MSATVKLPIDLVHSAEEVGRAAGRSPEEQIEFWVKVGKVAEENPDLPFHLIQALMAADREKPIGHYRFGGDD